MSRGLFISVEGPEGAGKSTQISFIHEWFQNQGFKTIRTREPGGTPLAEEIRETFLKIRAEPMMVNTELLLMFASRAQHVEGLIKPWLEKGAIVITDRFVDSSYAYQCGGRRVSYERLHALEKWTLGDFEPDVTLYFDIPIEVGMDRIARRGKLDRFEVEQQDFFRRVTEMYQYRRDINPHRCITIDANQSIEQVEKSLIPVLETLANKVRNKL